MLVGIGFGIARGAWEYNYQQLSCQCNACTAKPEDIAVLAGFGGGGLALVAVFVAGAISIGVGSLLWGTGKAEQE